MNDREIRDYREALMPKETPRRDPSPVAFALYWEPGDLCSVMVARRIEGKVVSSDQMANDWLRSARTIHPNAYVEPLYSKADLTTLDPPGQTFPAR